MKSEIGNTRITEYLLRKYCSDEGIDYNWVIKYKKEYPGKRNEEENPVAPLAFIPVSVKEEPQQKEWQVERLVLQSPTGETVEIKSTSLSVVAMLLEKMS